MAIDAMVIIILIGILSMYVFYLVSLYVKLENRRSLILSKFTEVNNQIENKLELTKELLDVLENKELNNVENISFTTTEAKKYYGDLRTFRADMDALIDFGFIKQVLSGVPRMEATIYGFSDRWKDYGTDKFYIPKSDRRYSRKDRIKSNQ